MASVIHVKNPNGNTYVYENVSYWNKEIKKTQHKRRCIGKLDQLTGDVIPNHKKRQQGTSCK